LSQLPIEAVIPELLEGVKSHTQLILKAAPGAGKSTYFPLRLLKDAHLEGKIIMLEPRRLAARNIARYLALQLGEPVGVSVGYRVRGDAQVSQQTMLEIVTEGILTRMIQADPELTGVSLLLFDEYHERSIHADTALALCLDIQSALRDDLRIVVMSATLDSLALQTLLPDAHYIESMGRGFTIDYRYQPILTHDSMVLAMVKQIIHLMSTEPGSLLAFLPGVSAIRQVEQQLLLAQESDRLAADIDMCPLYGQLDFAKQQRAIEPPPDGRRKVVLATNIAETSLTIEGIRLVVDSGLERVARFDINTGITRLDEVRIAQSSAEQRAGRAGRLEPGLCVRLYSASQLAQQPSVPEAEICHSDLTDLALELAQWGVKRPAELRWLDLPPQAAWAQAQQLLQRLNLIDAELQLTTLGKKAHQLGVDPRLASMLIHAHDFGKASLMTAIAAVALIEEPESNQFDLRQGLHRWQINRHAKCRVITQRCHALAKKFAIKFDANQLEDQWLGWLLSLAFPDRIAQSRVSAECGSFLLANGHGVQVRDDQPLAQANYLVAIDLMRFSGHGSTSSSSQVLQAVEVDIEALQIRAPQLFDRKEVIDWDEKRGRLTAERQIGCGRLVIKSQWLDEPDKKKMTQALLSYIRRKGLTVLKWEPTAVSWIARIRCAIEWLPDKPWPAMDETSLLDQLEEWLLPYMNGIVSVKGLQTINVVEALKARLGWPLNQQVDEWLPEYQRLPTGNRQKIRYEVGMEPVLSVRMQEMYGEQQSPTIALGKKRLLLELLSPAQRPLQVTQDLAAFWAGSYRLVQKEMKGRYPKHVWPDDPATHIATTKTKRQIEK
jgi:ATP-dependent helicase HrpB